jgi:hypothetical protein
VRATIYSDNERFRADLTETLDGVSVVFYVRRRGGLYKLHYREPDLLVLPLHAACNEIHGIVQQLTEAN